MPSYSDEPYKSVLATIVDQTLRCEFRSEGCRGSVVQWISEASSDMVLKYRVTPDVLALSDQVAWPDDPEELVAWVRSTLPYRGADIENCPAHISKMAWRVVHRIKAVLWTVVRLHRKRAGSRAEAPIPLPDVPAREAEVHAQSFLPENIPSDVLDWINTRLKGIKGEERNKRAKSRQEARELANENCLIVVLYGLKAMKEKQNLGVEDEECDFLAEALVNRKPDAQAAKDSGMSPGAYCLEKKRLLAIFLDAIARYARDDES